MALLLASRVERWYSGGGGVNLNQGVGLEAKF